uniref:Uncharacterized protein n=1 Tax=Peronospora matthiolae TaxID=2874970 RepID=A0AAV1V177_9STRA
MGYADHQKANRFEEIKSCRVLVSRDAQFMEDVFDSGRRDYVQAEVVLEDEEGSTDEDSSCSNKEKEETFRIRTPNLEASDINAHDHWKKRSIF